MAELRPLPALNEEVKPRSRTDLGRQLQHEGKHRSAEVGRNLGVYATDLLRHWTVCQIYFMIEVGNSTDPLLPALPAEWGAAQRKRWEGRLHRLRGPDGLRDVAPNSLDVVMVEAEPRRDDTLERLRDWWPKLREGGLFAMTDEQLPRRLASAAKSSMQQFQREVSRQAQELPEASATTWVIRR